MSECSYQIDPRPAELGGGWRLRLIEDGEEVGGGVFPLSEYATEDNAEEAAKCRRGIKFHTKQSSNPVCTVLNDTHPEIKIHTNSYYKI